MKRGNFCALSVVSYILAAGGLALAGGGLWAAFMGNSHLTSEQFAKIAVGHDLTGIECDARLPDGHNICSFDVGGETGYIIPFINRDPAPAERQALSDRFIHVISHEKSGDQDTYKLTAGHDLICSVAVSRTKHGYWQNTLPICSQTSQNKENQQPMSKDKAFE